MTETFDHTAPSPRAPRPDRLGRAAPLPSGIDRIGLKTPPYSLTPDELRRIVYELMG